jgi:hypothetical protein
MIDSQKDSNDTYQKPNRLAWRAPPVGKEPSCPNDCERCYAHWPSRQPVKQGTLYEMTAIDRPTRIYDPFAVKCDLEAPVGIEQLIEFRLVTDRKEYASRDLGLREKQSILLIVLVHTIRK